MPLCTTPTLVRGICRDSSLHRHSRPASIPPRHPAGPWGHRQPTLTPPQLRHSNSTSKPSTHTPAHPAASCRRARWETCIFSKTRERRIQEDGMMPWLERTPAEHCRRNQLPRTPGGKARGWSQPFPFPPYQYAPFCHRACKTWLTLSKGKQMAPGKMVPKSHATSLPAC